MPNPPTHFRHRCNKTTRAMAGLSLSHTHTHTRAHTSVHMRAAAHTLEHKKKETCSVNDAHTHTCNAVRACVRHGDGESECVFYVNVHALWNAALSDTK